MVSNSIGRDRLVGAEAARRRSRAVGFLLQVCIIVLPQRLSVLSPSLEPLSFEVGNAAPADTGALLPEALTAPARLTKHPIRDKGKSFPPQVGVMSRSHEHALYFCALSSDGGRLPAFTCTPTFPSRMC